MARRYKHIAEYEAVILRMKSEGKTRREIGEAVGFSKEQVKGLIKRCNRKQEKLADGMVIHQKADRLRKITKSQKKPKQQNCGIATASRNFKESTHFAARILLLMAIDHPIFYTYPHFLSVSKRKSRISSFSISSCLILTSFRARTCLCRKDRHTRMGSSARRENPGISEVYFCITRRTVLGFLRISYFSSHICNSAIAIGACGYNLLSVVRRKKYRNYSEHLHRYPNLLNRDFYADCPNQK